MAITSTANAPSFDIKDMLEDSNCGLSLVFGTNLFIGSLPDEPNNTVCLYDTGGQPQGQYSFEKPNLQIRVRNTSYVVGYALIRNIKYYLQQNRNNEVWNTTKYISITTRSEIFFDGQDEKNRYEWTINFQILRTG